MRKTILSLVLIGLTGAAAARPDIEVLARTCNGCHGVGGVSVSGPMPSIGGLPKDYLKRVMKQWKYGERTAITMDRIVKGFSDDQLDALAEYFSQKPWVPVPQAVSGDVLTKGKAAVSDDCRDCHGLTGNDPDVDAPKINGQWAKYMELELMKYRSGAFKMPHRKMRQAAQNMKPEEVSATARYFGAQGK
jgi:sulfide dehydrogenase cytochrome subunit